MTPSKLFHDLNDLLSLLLKSEIALSATNVIDVQGHRGHRRITWANNNNVPGDTFRFDSPTISEYQQWVDSQGYSAILFDGAIIQISYDFLHSELIGHRLLYFPCPFDMDMELLDEISLSELIKLYCEGGADHVRLRTPIRFDFDPKSWSSSHPASHMTFQWAHTRIAVNSPLSLGHFIQFVFHNFYPTYWNMHTFLNQWHREDLDVTISPEERSFLHLTVTNKMMPRLNRS